MIKKPTQMGGQASMAEKTSKRDGSIDYVQKAEHMANRGWCHQVKGFSLILGWHLLVGKTGDESEAVKYKVTNHSTNTPAITPPPSDSMKFPQLIFLTTGKMCVCRYVCLSVCMRKNLDYYGGP